jgi:aminoglycoside 3-N-acetyltransferase
MNGAKLSQAAVGLSDEAREGATGRLSAGVPAGRSALRVVARYSRALRHHMARGVRYAQRQKVRLEYGDVRAALDRFGPLRSDVLLVHSSLSACGQIRGGAATVLRALQDWLAGGTLIMPSHSYCYPEGAEEAPVFDPQSTPPEVGAIAHYFMKQPGVIRSAHPSHSLTCLGPRSQEICDAHEFCEAPCGPGSPYERLIQAGASVLMFGVPMACYTLFYTSEHAAGVPSTYFPERCRLRLALPSGQIHEIMSWRHSTVPRRFDAVGDLMEAEGLIARQSLGRGTLRLVLDAGDVHRWLQERLAGDPWLLADRPSREPVD